MYNFVFYNNLFIFYLFVRLKWFCIMIVYYEIDLRFLVFVLIERIEGIGDENFDS